MTVKQERCAYCNVPIRNIHPIALWAACDTCYELEARLTRLQCEAMARTERGRDWLHRAQGRIAKALMQPRGAK